MTAAERGFLLLGSSLGDETVRPLTVPQLRDLSRRVNVMGDGGKDPAGELRLPDLTELGYEEAFAVRILALLDREAELDRYLARAERQNIHAVTRVSPDYPARLSIQLGMEAPPVLFYRGDKTLLQRACISVVGSRKLFPENRAFARTAGRLIAEEGFVLCSGGAVGADSAAKAETIARGGSALIFLPGRLTDEVMQENVVFVTEDSFDLPFTAQRALSRNRLIHAMGEKTLVAQVRLNTGGTWRGAADNLHHGYSPVFVFDDGSEGAGALMARGAVGLTELTDLNQLEEGQIKLLL